MGISLIQYSEICEQDLEQIINLYETYLNSGKYIQDTMHEAFESKEYIGYKACDGNKVIGFFSGRGDFVFTYPHPELEKEIREFAGSRKLYNPDALLVLEQYRNHGIAGELVRRMKKSILAQKVELALVELWIYPDETVPAQNALMELGRVVFQKRVSEFYRNLSHYGIRCPICGDLCQCGALIQLLEIGEKV